MRRIYLDGNSLGPPPPAVRERMLDALDMWSRDLIGGWNAGWLELPGRIAAKIAGLVGAEPDEILVGDSTSLNLYKLAMAARSEGGVVSDDGNFPSDLYVLSGLGAPFSRVARPDAEWLAGTSLASFSHVDFRTGERHDMAGTSRRGRVIWDLAHSAGAIPVRLREDGAELAVGCGYKFLNGGPGAPAFLYVRRELQEELESPIRGWFGAADPFLFSPDYRPAAGIARFAAGTPPVLSLVALEAGIDHLIAAGPGLFAQGSRLTGLLIERLDDLDGFEILTPRDQNRRGSQVSVRHPEAWRIVQALIAAGVVPDYREPGIVRFGVAPLWNDERDIEEAAELLRRTMETRAYEAFRAEKPAVT